MKDLLVWIFIWAFVWILLNAKFKWWSLKQKNEGYPYKLLYFIPPTLLSTFVFKNIVYPKIGLLLTAFLISLLLGYFLSNYQKFFKRIRTGRYFLLAHPTNILFQQIMFLVGISLLQKIFVYTYKDFYFSVFLVLVHFPVIFFRWVRLRYLYLVFCIFGGAFFSLLIRNVEFGIFYTYLIHYLVYIGVIFYTRDEYNI